MYFFLQGMPYQFHYAVNDQYSGNDFGHQESSDGNVVTGKYYVQLPDGRRQVVTYTADHENGYQVIIVPRNVIINLWREKRFLMKQSLLLH